MRKYRLKFLCIFFALSLIVGCSSVSNIEDITKEGINIGAVGGVNALNTYLRFMPIADKISKVLRRPVRILSEWDIRAIKVHLENDPYYYQLLYLNPVDYCRLTQTVKLYPIAIRVNKRASTTEAAYIVVRKDSPIKKLSDLQNRTLAIGPYEDPYMFYNVFELLGKERVPTALIKGFVYCEDSLGVVRRLNLGLADAGVVTQTWWEKSEDRSLDLRRLLKDDLRIIAKTDDVPEYIWAATESLNEEERQKVAELIINGIKKELNILNSFEAIGFDKVDEKLLKEYTERLNKIKNIPPKPLF